MKRMLPGTRALRTFEAAGRHLNFTRAAQEVGLTPAAVSYQIKEIEDQLGITLFARNSRSIQLTPAGAVLFEAAAEALDTLQRATSRARRMARGPAHLRISLGAMFATSWLLPRLARFRAANPALELTFDISDQVRDFDTDDVDIAIRFGVGHYEDTCSDRLFDTLVVPICSPKLLEAGARLQTPRDLLGHTLCYVDCPVDGMAWPDWRLWMAAAGVDDFDDSRCVAFADSSHVVQAVIDGAAIGLVELPMIANDLAQGRLVRLFELGVRIAPAYAYHLVYPARSSQDPRILAFSQWMRDETAHPAQGIQAG
ncbi:LysR family transcriptional regulator [Cupriavidus basilensis OR16]|uniref:LysR family transcriptional regulator n=1 Tax=Cupriavidus basilensis OR16 TaxID=1127483 RepID=H1S440_9BURK|nr:transcriptional regulator GcvA [Cupriavidus basilensis]EHP42679.1 LysR family transcriptional regulator [Cupriavidus basilensis OR16]